MADADLESLKRKKFTHTLHIIANRDNGGAVPYIHIHKKIIIKNYSADITILLYIIAYVYTVIRTRQLQYTYIGTLL